MVREGKRVNDGQRATLCSGSSGRSLPDLLIFYLIKRPGGLRPEETLHVPPRWPPFTRFSSFNHSTTINGDAVLSVLRIAGRQHQISPFSHEMIND